MTTYTNIRIDFFMDGNKCEVFNDLKSSDTVSKLKQKIEDRVGGSKVTGVKLVYLGQPLSETSNSKTLEEIGLDDDARLLATLKLRGGSEGSGEISYELANKLCMILTTEKCSVCWEDGNSKRMGFSECGGKCQFCYKCIKNAYKKCIFDSNQTEVLCPVASECSGAVWKTTSVLKVLKLNKEESSKCYLKLNENYVSKNHDTMKACPGCKYIVRKEGINHNRVRCPNNECPFKKDWCFKCRQQWRGKSSNYKICGNSNCRDSKIANVTSLLINTQLKTIDNVSGVPNTRLCVGCTSVLTWTERCKHITCQHSSCKHQFCIICTRKWNGCNCGKPRCVNDTNTCKSGSSTCRIKKPEYQIQKLSQYIN